MKAKNTCERDGRLVIIGSHYTEPPVIGKGESVPFVGSSAAAVIPR